MRIVYSSIKNGNENVDVDVKGEDVAITAGCNMAFAAAALAVATAGDEVILPVPWYALRYALKITR